MAKLYKNENANNIFMELFSAGENTGEIKLNKQVPNTTDAAHEKHVPVITVNGNIVEVVVGSVEHPMMEQHYITGIYLETTKGGQLKHLSPGEAPKASFIISENEEVVAAYEYCNLHGLWEASIQEKCAPTKKYICNVCSYEYDPAIGDADNGIEAGTAFEDIPDDWVCPLCGASKEEFSPIH